MGRVKGQYAGGILVGVLRMCARVTVDVSSVLYGQTLSPSIRM